MLHSLSTPNVGDTTDAIKYLVLVMACWSYLYFVPNTRLSNYFSAEDVTDVAMKTTVADPFTLTFFLSRYQESMEKESLLPSKRDEIYIRGTVRPEEIARPVSEPTNPFSKMLHASVGARYRDNLYACLFDYVDTKCEIFPKKMLKNDGDRRVWAVVKKTSARPLNK